MSKYGPLSMESIDRMAEAAIVGPLHPDWGWLQDHGQSKQPHGEYARWLLGMPVEIEDGERLSEGSWKYCNERARIVATGLTNRVATEGRQVSAEFLSLAARIGHFPIDVSGAEIHKFLPSQMHNDYAGSGPWMFAWTIGANAESLRLGHCPPKHVWMTDEKMSFVVEGLIGAIRSGLLVIPNELKFRVLMAFGELVSGTSPYAFKWMRALMDVLRIGLHNLSTAESQELAVYYGPAAMRVALAWQPLALPVAQRGAQEYWVGTFRDMIRQMKGVEALPDNATYEQCLSHLDRLKASGALSPSS